MVFCSELREMPDGSLVRVRTAMYQQPQGYGVCDRRLVKKPPVSKVEQARKAQIKARLWEERGRAFDAAIEGP